MMYSIIGMLAIVILFITNWDILFNRGGKKLNITQKYYRGFLLGILSYYITDALWGILDANRLTTLQFADTELYFAAMAAALLLWTRYVVSYLENENIFGKALTLAGRIFFILEIAAVIVNIFYPILFWFDEAGDYHAGIARYITLAVQILMFFLTSVYTLRVTSKSEGKVRRRHLTIGLFGIAMVLLIIAQVLFPLLPLYAIGYMLGTCLMHTFVVEDEKEQYRRELEEALEREHQQMLRLSESREALNDALSAAEHANKAKTTFLSNMSHEIRTPMNAIIGLNNIALNDPTLSDSVREDLVNIGGAAEHLLEIINDILDMSRIESGRMVLNSIEFSFRELLEQINTMIGGQCRDKGLDYKCVTKGNLADHYIGDSMKLKQILINILGNAVKFTPEGGTVAFEVEDLMHYDKKAVLKFIVRDTGIGMSEDYLPHIFDAFSQENASLAQKYGSSGLGMPITKSLVELMNGKIEAESEKGVGSTFTVTVTLGEANEAHASEPAKALEGSDKAELKGRHVLLAEDIALNAEIMVMVLGMREINVDVAENGRIALEKYLEQPEGYYDAVLMDMRMPEMDGLEATAAIRASGRDDAGTIPIIALTANAFDDDVKRSLQAGLNAHLSKPVEPDILFDTLEKLITQG